MYLLINPEKDTLLLESNVDLQKIYKVFNYIFNGITQTNDFNNFDEIQKDFKNHDFELIALSYNTARHYYYTEQHSKIEFFSNLNRKMQSCSELDICIIDAMGEMFLKDADKFSIDNYGVYFQIIMFLDFDNNFRTSNENIDELYFDYNGEAFFYELSKRENHVRLELLKYLKWNDSNGDFMDSLEEKPLSLNDVLEILERQETEDLAEHPPYILDLIKEVKK